VASDRWKVLVEQQVVDSSLWEVKQRKARAHSRKETVYIFIGDIDHRTRKPLPFPDTQFRGQGPHVEFQFLSTAHKWVQTGQLEGGDSACQDVAQQVCAVALATDRPPERNLLVRGALQCCLWSGAMLAGHACRQELQELVIRAVGLHPACCGHT
jgi:hypothetical protein